MTVRSIYPDELLDLADHLVGPGRGRPRTIYLRRAVSTAYYALFHQLTYLVVVTIAAPEEWDQNAMNMARWINHTDLATLCQAAVGKGNGAVQGALRPVGEDVRYIAQAFLDLQDERHQADYADNYEITRGAAATFVGTSRDAVRRSARLFQDADPGYRRFLALGLGSVRIAKTRG